LSRAPVSPSSSSPSPPKLRADAARNRARILDTAQTLFAERGADVQMEEVARRAGVGIGTLYRHFPTKEAMIEAAAERRFEDSVVFARAQIASDDDPWEILVRILRHCAEEQSADRGFSLVVETTIGATVPSCATQGQFEQVMADVIERGKAAGSIRPDVVPADVSALACGLAAVIRNQSGDWRRVLDIMVEGLRTH
jgi:AcrR family transcriptional regulator